MAQRHNLFWTRMRGPMAYVTGVALILAVLIGLFVAAPHPGFQPEEVRP